MKIAVSGKGGVGKTTVSANLAKIARRMGYNVLALDADPDSSLGYALGVDPETLLATAPLSELEDEIAATMGDGAMYVLNPDVSSIPDKYAIDVGGIKLLRMGAVKSGSSECYCRENMFLKAVVSSLLLGSKDVVILDMGAGIEHLTRGTSSGVDVMLIVTEAGFASVQTARVVEKLSGQMGVKHVKFIANKIRSDEELEFIKRSFTSKELLGVIPYDPTVAQKGMGVGITDEADSPELEAMLKTLLK